MNTVIQRLEALRAAMADNSIDVYLVPTDDFHQSEYVGEYFKCRKFITGFTGSAGTAVITQEMAGLWTDGRYFIQAEAQLKGSTVQLFKMGEPGVPTVHAFVKDIMKDGQTLGFDGRVVGAGEADRFAEELSSRGITINMEHDLVGDIWPDRPERSREKIWELDSKWCGEERRSKLTRIREAVLEKEADAFLLASLDDIAWLLNLRGNDVACNPVFLSYVLMTKEETMLFANTDSFSPELKETLAADQVRVLEYDSVYEVLQSLSVESILLNRGKINARLLHSIPENAKIIDAENPTFLPKAIKNETEVNNIRTAHLKDGVAVTKFIYWLKTRVGKEKITEILAAKKLFSFRSEQENFLEDSFEPIISYGSNAAIVHYSATEESDTEILPRGMVLADTGGQYYEGTTDITRTIVVGELTDEEKKMFTAVLRGHLNLADVVFRYGCTGMNFDYLAREPLWKLGRDYNHGTGHGVGYLLNVHEGPNGFRWRKVPERDDGAVFEEGMITSNEPGYYEEGRFGIRHESLMLCRKAFVSEGMQFMDFEELTLVPFDLDGIIPEDMTKKERTLLNQYHRTVYEKISPYLNAEEAAWLASVTREI